MIYLIIFIIPALLISGIWFTIFIINKGKIKFIINDNLNSLDWNSKFPEINQEKNPKKLSKLYEKIILCDIFPMFFEIISKNKTDLTEDDLKKEYSEFENEHNKLKNYEEKNKYWLKKIFKGTGRIAYKNFKYDFDYICKIDNKTINIIRLKNCFHIQGDGSIDSGRRY